MAKYIYQFTFSLIVLMLFNQSCNANTYSQNKNYMGIQTIGINAISREATFAPKARLTSYRITLGHRFKRKTAHRLEYVQVRISPTNNVQNIAAVRYRSYSNSVENYWP